MKFILITLLLVAAYITTTTATAQVERGPYEVSRYETEAYNKANVAEDQVGVPLQYNITIQRNGRPIAGARLDIWSANAAGLYSGVAADNTLNQDFLRGWQMTNASGQVIFNAVYPGAYSRRTNHAHFRVRQYAADGVTVIYNNTTQLFFPQNVSNQVMEASTYSTATWNRVNSNDGLFESENVVRLTGNVQTGFVATYTIEIPLTDGDDTPNRNLNVGSSALTTRSQNLSAGKNRRHLCRTRKRVSNKSDARR